MPLSRLENFLKNVEGNILYVNPTDLDATDSIENQGNSLTRPFKTIQRALLEAARFSYQIGQDNDKFDRTTVLLYPGEHEIDNRPGLNVVTDPDNASAALFRDRQGNIISNANFPELSDSTNYNLDDPTNELYKYNSVEGGVIVPRGVSIAGYDVRKTKIRPKFVPDPENAQINKSAIFRMTGGCHFWAVSFFDANPKESCYKDYTTNKYLPQFSHHKLTVFEYADGVNGVGIGTSTTTTDLQMYFHKVQRAFGDDSGRGIADFPVNTDMQPKLPEFEITGPVVVNDISVSQIIAGDGSTPTSTITVDTSTAHGLVVDSAIRIAGVTTFPNIYNGNFTVTGVSSERRFTYEASSTPTDATPTIGGVETIVPDTDNVTGSSPYIFHCSLRSAYGMCGLHADGSKASGFKSMLVAQFTGIGLQKDNNAFLVYNKTTGQYDNNGTAPSSEKPLYLNGSSRYRPTYKNSHIKASNNAFVQAVSVFAVGFSEHFTSESGGDMSITNSNSNFGSVSLNAKGFKDSSFAKDNRGYITHIIPPESQFQKNISVEWEAIDVTKTLAASVDQEHIFLDGFTDPAIPPVHVINGYRIGAKAGVDGIIRTNPDLLNVSIAGVGTYSAEIIMQNKTGGSDYSTMKVYDVERTGVINSITDSKITLTSAHQLSAGESIRVISDDGFLPDGIDTNVIYYAVTNASTQESSLTNTQIKLARNKNDALLGGSGNIIAINNNKGGVLTIESRVSDKKPGDLGHPIQYDTTKGNWYIQVKGTSNEVYAAVNSNSAQLGPRTGKTFIRRKEDTRSLNDKIYRLRYVIPKESSDARPPIPGYTLQESSTVGVSTSGEFTNDIPNVTVQRNLRIVKSVDRDPNTGITTVVTEKPHNLIMGDDVQFKKIRSGGNSAGTINEGYNIVRDIVGITSAKGFEVLFYDTDPGTFTDTSTNRSDNLPTVSRRKHKDTFTVYRAETIKSHDYQRQDGVYHLICVDSSISPTVNEYTNSKFNQNITDLYPQYDADNFNMDPSHAASFALNTPIGKVVTNDLRGSLSKEFTNNFIVGNQIGYAVTGAASHTNGITTVWTNVEHNFNTIIKLALAAGGSGYGSAGILYNVELSGGSGHGATANVTVNGAGVVTAVEIVDGGAGYTKGNTLNVKAGAGNATVTVSAIHSNIGDAIQIVGVGTVGNRYNSGYNGIHTVTSVTPKSVTYQLPSGKPAGIHSTTTAGIHTGFFMLAGNAPRINSISYSNPDTGIAVVTTDEPHGLSVNNSFSIVGAAQTIYNGDHLVFEKNSTTQFSFKFTEKFTPATYTTSGGKAQVLPVLYGAKGGKIVVGDEKLAERQVPLAVGISTTLSNAAWTAVNTTLTLTDSSGFIKGDYIQIDDEIVRVSADFSSNAATVLRGQLGSRAETHLASSLAKKIRVLPVEKRRASVLRASGHTFEYLGFGPGNYSTSFPEKQDRILTREENFLAQSTTDNGGSVVYTGVNDAGDFHIGNKVVNSQDGTEATFNIPIPTTTGSGAEGDSASGRLDVIFDSVNIREGLIVDGNNNTTVRINAPTTVTKKLTSSSDDGAEFVSIDLTGGLSPSRTITYTATPPTGSSTLGDILFKANPDFGDHLGWVYTSQGWKQFGLIATEKDRDQLSLGIVGLGSTSASRAGKTDSNGVLQGYGGALDVRGAVVADYLLMTGISTFLGTTLFTDVTIGRLLVTGSLNVTGITTFTKGVIFDSSDEGVGITTFNNNVHFDGATAGRDILWDKSDNALEFADNTKATFGAGTGDIQIYSDGSSGFIDSPGNSTLFIRNATSGGSVKIQGNSGEESIIANHNGSVDLYHDNTKRLETKDDGVNIIGTLETDNLTNTGVSTFSGTVNLNGEINLGDGAADTISAIGRYDTNLVPSTDGARDLGASGLEWKDLYLDGTANIDSLIADTADINGGTIDGTAIGGNTASSGAFTTLSASGGTNLNGNIALGNAITDTITPTGRFDAHLVPLTDNAVDLGASGVEFKDLYLDGTANIDSLVADTAKISDLSLNKLVYSSSADGELSDVTGFSYAADNNGVDRITVSKDDYMEWLGGNGAANVTGSFTGSINVVGSESVGGTSVARNLLITSSNHGLPSGNNSIGNGGPGGCVITISTGNGNINAFNGVYKVVRVTGTKIELDRAWVVLDPESSETEVTGITFTKGNHGNEVSIQGDQITVINKIPSQAVFHNLRIRNELTVPGTISIEQGTVSKSLFVFAPATIYNLTLDRASNYSSGDQSGNLTVQGESVFSSTGITTIPHLHAGNLNVVSTDGNTGISTFGGNIDANGNLDVDGTTDLDTTNIVGNLTLTSGHGQFDNIRIDGNTISSQNTNGVITLDPAGTGDVNIEGPLDVNSSANVSGTATLATVDINAGNIDGTAIGSASRSTGKFTTLDANSNLSVGGNGTVTGTFDVDGATTLDGLTVAEAATFNADVTFTGDNYSTVWDKSESRLRFGDNAKATFGGNNDASMYHNDSHFFIDNTKGHMYIQNGGSNDNSNIYIRARDGEDSIIIEDDGRVILYHDDSWRLQTTSSGVSINGTTTSTAFSGPLTGNVTGNVTGNLTGTASNADKLDNIDSASFLRSDDADTSSQRITFAANSTHNWDGINTTTGSRGCIEIYNNGSGNDAFMAFHVGSDYACYFGLDGGTNKLSVGGWSMGAASYAIYHEGNNPSFSQLGITAANINALGINAQKVDDIEGASLLRSDQDDSFSGAIWSTSRHNGIFGTYDSYKTDSIWSMGTGYKNHSSGTNFGNLYGLAYKHTNNTTGGTMGGSHQMVWCANGVPNGAIGSTCVWHSSAMKVTSSNHTVWHVGNDGPASGLNADLLDNQHGSYYRNASNINAGTIHQNYLGTSGTRSSTYFLAGDNVWRQVVTDLVNDTSPQLGGHLASNGKNISFADSTTFGTDDTLQFGASNDLQIFHGASNAGTYANTNVIKTQGSNDTLLIEIGSTSDANFALNNRYGSSSGSIRNMIVASGAGSVKLYNNGSKKLETQSDGVDITGKIDCSASGSKIPAADVTSGVTKVYAETSNNNIAKHASAAAIRTFLNVADGANNTSPFSVNHQTFTGNGTWNKPSSGTFAIIFCRGGGGGGSKSYLNYAGGAGGGGGACAFMIKTLSSMSSSYSISIGGGGNGASGTYYASGNNGGGSSVGSLITAHGGEAGTCTSSNNNTAGDGGGFWGQGPGYFGGQGGNRSWQSDGSDDGGTNVYENLKDRNSDFGGGGGGNHGNANAKNGGSSIWGGGGGGSSQGGSGGNSVNGGAGGAGGTNGSAGSIPSGGGGGGRGGGSGASGARGQVDIYVI